MEHHCPRAAATTSTSPGTATRIVVIGDSAAAGLGNRPVAQPSRVDRACGRSRDSFAADLATTTGWPVTNLAYSGATIAQGLLGRRTPTRTPSPPSSPPHP